LKLIAPVFDAAEVGGAPKESFGQRKFKSCSVADYKEIIRKKIFGGVTSTRLKMD